MTKTNLLCRVLLLLLLPCFAAASTASPPLIKTRLSTSLREDDDDPRLQLRYFDQKDEENESDNSAISELARPSKTMVTGTIFGARRGHVWFCIQHDRLSTKPSLIIELFVPTQQLVREMRSGELLRLTLESSASSDELVSCPLRSVPAWTVSCNVRKIGFAVRRKATEETRLLLKTMESVTVSAGVVPAVGPASVAIMYMRANYEHVVGAPIQSLFI